MNANDLLAMIEDDEALGHDTDDDGDLPNESPGFDAASGLDGLNAASGLEAASGLDEAPGFDAASGPRLNAMEILALVANPNQGPQAKATRRRRLAINKKIGRKNELETSSSKIITAKALRFNTSGLAVTMDKLIVPEGGGIGKVSGSSGWRCWLPEAVQRAGFSPGTAREIAVSFREGHGPLSGGKYSPQTIQDCKAVIAKAIMDGTKGGLQQLHTQSLAEDLDYYITGHVFDETKLWYILQGKGYKRWSTLAFHTQVSWGDAAGAHDEDVIRKPVAMERYSAATQWAIMTEDPVAGILPCYGSRPQAKFYGTLLSMDSHRVNKLTVKVLRLTMPADHLLLPNWCLQHQVGNTASAICVYLCIFTRVWTLCKTFCEGDFFVSLLKHMHDGLDDEDDGLEVVDPELFQLSPGDWGQDFSKIILDRCFKSSREPGSDEQDEQQRCEEVKAEFIKFFPVGWNRRRALHLCPPGLHCIL